MKEQTSEIWLYVWSAAAALVSGLISYYAGKEWTNRQLRSLETTTEYGKVRGALDAYLRWLTLLRLHIDPQDSACLNARDAASLSDGRPSCRSRLEELIVGASAGSEVSDALDHAKYDLPLAHPTLQRLRDVVDAVGEYFAAIKASQWPVDSVGGPDYYCWALARGLVDLDQLEAKEVFLAETIFSDLRSEVHRAYKRGILGGRALRDYDSTAATSRSSVFKRRRVRWHLIKKHLRYEGEVPFKSPRYLGERDRPTKEWLQSQSGGNEPEEDLGSGCQ